MKKRIKSLKFYLIFISVILIYLLVYAIETRYFANYYVSSWICQSNYGVLFWICVCLASIVALLGLYGTAYVSVIGFVVGEIVGELLGDIVSKTEHNVGWFIFLTIFLAVYAASISFEAHIRERNKNRV